MAFRIYENLKDGVWGDWIGQENTSLDTEK